jgi:hypothetical protein
MIPFRHFFPLFIVLVSTVYTVCAQSTDCVLDCTFRGGNEIFALQQSIVLDVTFRSPAPNAAPSTLHAALTDLSSPERLRIAEFNTQIVPNTPLPISFVTPSKEGVYEITLAVHVQAAEPSRLFSTVPRPHVTRLPERPTTTARPPAEVNIQFVVLSPQVSPRSVGDWMLSEKHTLPPVADSPSRRLALPFPKVGELPKMSDLPKISDLPRPAELLKMPPLIRLHSPDLPSKPYVHFGDGTGYLSLPTSAGHFSEKSEQNPNFSALSPAGSNGCTWYSLPMETEIGKPYLIEIDYPANISQAFGLGVLDYLLPQEQSGSMAGPVNTAATVYIAKEIAQDTPTETTATHQLLFWATTESPVLVLLNRQSDQEALFRNIRISLAATFRQQEVQRLPKLFEGAAQRKRIGQLMNADGLRYGALQSNGTMNWQKAYEECSHLLDRLCRGGYDGVTLTVRSKNSTLPPLPLEMMFQRFDSEELTLIPAIEFNMPIASLEQLVQQHPAVTEEILIGNPEDRRYNLLHPAVQQAMSEIVLELADRFGHHPSFGGVAIVLSPETYAQLPFTLYPPDDYTFAQFRQETESTLAIPFPDEQQFRQAMPMQQFLAQKNTERIRFLQSDPKVGEAWIRWRTAKISGFYAYLATQVTAKRTDVPLYLLGGTMFDQPEIQEYCAPTLPQNFAALQALRLLGFDMSLIANVESLHFLKPVPISAVPVFESKNYSYSDLNSADTAALFSKSGIVPGVQFIHTDTHHFVTAPAHNQSRKRFVQQLAQADVCMFMDGGCSLPSGQEPEMFDLLATYRQLPLVAFQTFQPSAKDAPPLQPLTVRYKNSPEGMTVYIVNDAPFAVEADFFFSAEAQSSMTELTGHRMIRSFNRNLRSSAGTASHTWRASLFPYDLLAIRISDTNAKIESVLVHRPPSLCGAEGVLKQKVDDLVQRVHAVRNGVLWNGLFNADFELPMDPAGGITGWHCFGTSLTAQLDQTAVCKGQNSIKLTNGSSEPGTFLSQPLTIPATGRLGVSVFVGVSADCKSLPMNVVLSAKYRDKPYYRSVPVGETLMSSYFAHVEPKNGVRWHRLVVPLEHLPLESLEDVRIGIQYLGSGSVWLDDISLYQVWFSENEMRELLTILPVADQRCSSGRVSELTSLLEGYWTQFLFQHVPMPQSSSKPPLVKETSVPQKSPTMSQRVRGWFGL